MPLHVYSARIGIRDPDALDVTRTTGQGLGVAFAPSAHLLADVLAARRESQRLRDGAMPLFEGAEGMERRLREAESIEEAAWQRYVPRYLDQMRASYADAVQRFGKQLRAYGKEAGPWGELLARERVVLCCYCGRADRCHRYLLRVQILPALGAVDCGESSGFAGMKDTDKEQG